MLVIRTDRNGREGKGQAKGGRTVDRTADGEIVHCDLSITFQINRQMTVLVSNQISKRAGRCKRSGYNMKKRKSEDPVQFSSETSINLERTVGEKKRNKREGEREGKRMKEKG